MEKVHGGLLKSNYLRYKLRKAIFLKELSWAAIVWRVLAQGEVIQGGNFPGQKSMGTFPRRNVMRTSMRKKSKNVCRQKPRGNCPGENFMGENVCVFLRLQYFAEIFIVQWLRHLLCDRLRLESA